ncbi:protein ALP1 [Artemisia annua]|uniref:Protein ALP1 n=1 Tax=Artemisia annua TaxID=35608 RepID=A0A2U1M753_ARTAN|nr:protein ALP1 [Artemisia annua]
MGQIDFFCSIKSQQPIFMTWFRLSPLRIKITRPLSKSKEQKRLERMIWLNRLIRESDIVCVSQLRMDRSTFVRLCEIGCLSALDGTSIRVTPPSDKKPRCWILLCSRLSSPLSRSTISSQRVSWSSTIERCKYFNMKYSKARNVIERCFRLLKGRWKILAFPSFFPITTQVRIILACCLLHNLIRKYMRVDPQELEQDEEDEIEHEEQLIEEACLSHITSTDEWYNFRDGLAHQMFNTWRETSNP